MSWMPAYIAVRNLLSMISIDNWGICRELPPHKRGIHRRKGFLRELPAHRRGIHPRKGIPLGITSLSTRIQAGKIKICGKSFERKQFQDQQLPNLTYWQYQL
jgi:hypothetical protein